MQVERADIGRHQRKERTANWFKYFQGLLDNSSNIGGQVEEIDQISQELNINDG